MRKLRLVLSLPVLLWTLACDAPTRPDVVARVEGSWTYSVPQITVGLQQCAILDLTILLRQEGATFSGETAGGTSTCVTGQPEPVGRFPVSEGIVEGRRVAFHIAEVTQLQLRNEGTLSGDTLISGTVTFTDEFGAPFVTAPFVMRRN